MHDDEPLDVPNDNNAENINFDEVPDIDYNFYIDNLKDDYEQEPTDYDIHVEVRGAPKFPDPTWDDSHPHPNARRLDLGQVTRTKGPGQRIDKIAKGRHVKNTVLKEKVPLYDLKIEHQMAKYDYGDERHPKQYYLELYMESTNVPSELILKPAITELFNMDVNIVSIDTVQKKKGGNAIT